MHIISPLLSANAKIQNFINRRTLRQENFTPGTVQNAAIGAGTTACQPGRAAPDTAPHGTMQRRASSRAMLRPATYKDPHRTTQKILRKNGDGFPQEQTVFRAQKPGPLRKTRLHTNERTKKRDGRPIPPGDRQPEYIQKGPSPSDRKRRPKK